MQNTQKTKSLLVHRPRVVFQLSTRSTPCFWNQTGGVLGTPCSRRRRSVQIAEAFSLAAGAVATSDVLLNAVVDCSAAEKSTSRDDFD